MASIISQLLQPSVLRQSACTSISQPGQFTSSVPSKGKWHCAHVGLDDFDLAVGLLLLALFLWLVLASLWSSSTSFFLRLLNLIVNRFLFATFRFHLIVSRFLFASFHFTVIRISSIFSFFTLWEFDLRSFAGFGRLKELLYPKKTFLRPTS